MKRSGSWRISRFGWTKSFAPLIAVFSIAISVGGAFVLRSHTEDSTASLLSPSPLPVALQDGTTPGRVEAEFVAIRPWGFEPSSISRPKGRFILKVHNRSGLEQVSLRLQHQAGSQLRQVTVPRQKLDWGEGFDLTPGIYLLTEDNHPKWVCRIEIKIQ